MDSQGVYRGPDADTRRAVAAAIFNGDAGKVRWVVPNSQARVPALQSGQVDLLSRTFTWTEGRDVSSGIAFTAVNFHEGQGSLVRKSLGLLGNQGGGQLRRGVRAQRGPGFAAEAAARAERAVGPRAG
jgi:general L-amino acid transport system substrate-binding protein